jgi:hypothetical protein
MIPEPIPIRSKARFSSTIFHSGIEPLCDPLTNILASAPFSISASLSLFLVEKNR